MSAIPVSFVDIGKSANDLLGKDYPNAIKLDAKTTAPNGVSFTVSGSRDAKAGNIQGELKTKYAYPKSGVTFTGGWSSFNRMSGQLELENNVAKGLKLDISASLHPSSGQKSAKTGVIFKQPGFHTKIYLDLFKGPTFTGDAVIGHEGFLIGSEATYNVMSGEIVGYGIAAGFVAPEYNISIRASNSLSTYTAAVYHRVHSDVEAGAKAHWDTTANQNNNVNIEIGAKYTIDKDAFIKTKIDNAGRLGLGYTQTLRRGVKISLGASIDTSRLNENTHRFGLALNLES